MTLASFYFIWPRHAEMWASEFSAKYLAAGLCPKPVVELAMVVGPPSWNKARKKDKD